MNKNIIMLCVVAVFAMPVLSHSTSLKVPYLTGTLVDEMGVVESRERQVIETMLNQINASGRVQMAILVADSLQDMDIEGYSIAVAEQWKLGKKGKDNGLIFVVAPREHRMRLEVGYGLEGDLPDVYAKRIIDDLVAPYFRAGRFADGLMIGVEAVAKRLDINLSAPVERLQESSTKSVHSMRRASHFFYLIIILLFALLSLIPRRRGFWGGGGGGYWGGGGGGWGGGGFGGGGGGFSGGGGGFGGGGSSGSW